MCRLWGLALPPYPLAREGTESPDNLGAFWSVFCLVCGTGCVLLRDWQHEENLEKGRNAQRVRAEEHPVASRRSQTQ